MFDESPIHLASDDGFALPTVLFMLLAAFAIASIAVVSSINAQHGTTRDMSTKDALAAAEAGVQQALVRYNAGAVAGTCASGDTLQSGWCSAPQGSIQPGGTFNYSVLPGAGVIDIVSLGTVGGVTRKVHVTAHSAAGNSPFVDFGVIGRDSVVLDSNGEITADTASNGDVTLGNGASTFLCGNVQVGAGHDILPAGTSPSCGGQETQGVVNLANVNEADVRTNNNNDKFFGSNPVSGKKDDVCWNGATPDGGVSPLGCQARELYIRQNSGVTLTTGNYSFCKLTLRQNSILQIAGGSTVRIYFDTPEACGYPSGTVQLDMDSNTEITANGSSGAGDVALLFMGSDSRSTGITLASNTFTDQNCNQNFVIYAPRTDITFASNAHYCGAIAGKTIHLNQQAHITTNNLASGFELPNAPAHYTIDRFVECAAQSSVAC